MTESAGADTRAAVRIRRDVEDDVVRPVRIARHSPDAREVIQAKQVPNAPRDVVISARRVAADADAADQNPSRPVQAEAAAKDVDAADLLAAQRFVCRAVAG